MPERLFNDLVVVAIACVVLVVNQALNASHIDTAPLTSGMNAVVNVVHDIDFPTLLNSIHTLETGAAALA